MWEFEIEDIMGMKHEYRLALHTPKTGGLKIAKDIGSLFLPALGNKTKIGETIVSVDFENLVDRLMMFVHRDGKALREAVHFDQAFSGNYGELYELVGTVVKANNFLGSMSGTIYTMMKELNKKEEITEEPSKEPLNTESTGSSSE